MNKKKKIQLAIVFSICFLIVFVSTFMDSSIPSARPTYVRELRRYVPEVIEVFEQSREQLEILRTGGFGERVVEVHYFADGLSMDEGGRWVNLQYWHTLEWLSEEEIDALVFLMTSEELSMNFIHIGNGMRQVRGGERVQIMEATLYWILGPRGLYMEIWHGEYSPYDLWMVRVESSYSVYLGYGYTLWLFTTGR